MSGMKKWKQWVMKDIPCEQCKIPFRAKRAWSRFCSSRCRDKWFYLERRRALAVLRQKKPLPGKSPRAAFLKSFSKDKT